MFCDKGEFQRRERLLKANKWVVDLVDEHLKNIGLNPKLSGYKYFVDIISFNVMQKKYSSDPMVSHFNYIADKYGVKPCSIQRQLRWLVLSSYKNKEKDEEEKSNKILPLQIVAEAFYIIRRKIDKIEESTNGNKKIQY